MIKTTRKVEIKFPGERITQSRVLEDGSCELVVEIVVNEESREHSDVREQSEICGEMNDDVFILVEASKLSLDDEFMKHKPKHEREKTFKKLLTKVIKKGVKDFYCPKYDPSFNGDYTGITFKACEKLAVGKSYNWWKEVAEKFMPERHSRLGTLFEYVAFLGVIIKRLVEKGWNINEAWNVVCDESKKLGDYLKFKDTEHELEDTVLREICGFFKSDKILAADEDEYTDVFWVAGGSCYNYDGGRLFAYLFRRTCRTDSNNDYSIGWVVHEK